MSEPKYGTEAALQHEASWRRKRGSACSENGILGRTNEEIAELAAAEKRGYLRGLAVAEEIAVEVAANKHGSAGFVANKIAERRRAAE